MKDNLTVNTQPEVNSAASARGFSWLLTVFISLLISALSVFVYDRFFAQKVVAIDIHGYVAKQKELYVGGKLSDTELEQNLERIKGAITKIPKNKVVIVGDVVLKNAEVISP